MNIKNDKDVDTLNFKIIDPKGKEDWADLTPRELYSELNDIEESALLCCDGCGFIGCWTVLVSVEMDEDYAYWKEFRHNHRKWEYNISYKFDRREYEDALKQLEVLDEQENQN